MSKKSNAVKAKPRPGKAGQKMDRRWIALAAGILVVVVVVLLVLSNNAQQQANLGSALATSGSQIRVTPMKFDAAPPMTIDKTRQYYATVKLVKGGEFVIQLYPDKAPITVNSFVFLAKQGFFTGITFHRVIDGFMAQAGDPTGAGSGGPGYQFVNENSDLKFDKAGVVAMANAGPNTNGSQFFITFLATPSLNDKYTIFGQVVSGMEVVNGITRRDPNLSPTFTGDMIQSITIAEK
jgi:peptidylprolyl isomerase